MSASAETWPKELTTPKGGVITIYQPQPESIDGNKVSGRAAFSAKELPGDDLAFGVFWYTAAFVTDRDNRLMRLEKILITDVRLPGEENTGRIEKLKKFLETEIPKWKLTASLDEITATLEQSRQAAPPVFKNDPPSILFTTKPTMLVLIDGEPRFGQDEKLKMRKVINSAFLIIENPDDKKFYLYGGLFWYVSASVTDGYASIKTLPKKIAAIDKELQKDGNKDHVKPDSIAPSIQVSIKPAELVQTDGEPQYASIEGTSLLYVSNTQDDLFKYVTDQNYYLLLSGRWFAATQLNGPWSYVESGKLPSDFAAIPEGSAKDNVLASVPGTEASRSAVLDAQVPQTAKVERTAKAPTVTYDGAPKFEAIEGTSLQLAMNSKSTVLKDRNHFYLLDNGVWFVSDQAVGPWKVSDVRPTDLDKIPASSPAYNSQYVYIYDSTPDVVYVGYTPGYMGCYVYGGTVIYGTGYYYNPWYGPYYYPHPVTYGFSMHYNPWCGWSMGFHYSSGWFSFSVYGGGYWGPPMYHPPYHPPYRGGMYGGRGPVNINHYNNINIDRTNNIYNRRSGVATNDIKGGGQRASTLPANGKQNNVFGDKNGNVYQRNNNGDWNQRNGNQWKQTQQPSNMNRDFENRQRSQYQNNSFQQMNRGGNMGGRGGGGGGRRR